MAADLHERLSDLASQVPPASPPPDLWSRGVRRRRMLAAGRAGVALVLALLVGMGGWTWYQSRPVQPAEALGISVGTVKSQARDALRRLRDEVPGLADLRVSR